MLSLASVVSRQPTQARAPAPDPPRARTTTRRSSSKPRVVLAVARSESLPQHTRARSLAASSSAAPRSVIRRRVERGRCVGPNAQRTALLAGGLALTPARRVEEVAVRARPRVRLGTDLWCEVWEPSVKFGAECKTLEGRAGAGRGEG